MPRAAPSAQECRIAYPPAIAELETSRRGRLIDLSTQVSCEAAVAVHHCEYMSVSCFPSTLSVARFSRGFFDEYSAILLSPFPMLLASHVLCLSHWSTECLGLFPPF
jgi:hypothetical protein